MNNRQKGELGENQALEYLTKKYESDSDLVRAEIEKYMIQNQVIWVL